MTRYPLTWPAGWKRTPSHAQKRAQFGKMQQRTDASWKTKTEVTIAEGTKRILTQLQMMGVNENDVLISTNVKLRIDGLPRSDQRMPDDPGVAVYWRRGRDPQHKVIATDQYDRVADNMAAIAASLEAMRAIERHGGAVILERAFMGFEALPSPNDWRHVMGFDGTPTFAVARQRYHDLAKSRHPDAGGTDAMFQELTRAWSDAQRELGSDHG